MTSRLFRSIVVFGAGLGVTSGVVTLVPGCELYFGPDTGHGSDHGSDAWPIIDIGGDTYWSHIADAGWGIIDAGRPDVLPDVPPDPGSSAPHADGSHETGESR